jgi:hypothetical protein
MIPEILPKDLLRKGRAKIGRFLQEEREILGKYITLDGIRIFRS